MVDHRATKLLTETIEAGLPAVYQALDLADPTVSVLLADDDTVRELNARWRGIDEPTDVLSFPAHTPESLPENPGHLGDVVISIPCAERYTQSGDHRRRMALELNVDPDELSWSLVDEVSFLFVHGLLHLLGYDHTHLEEEARMRSAELRLWRILTSP